MQTDAPQAVLKSRQDRNVIAHKGGKENDRTPQILKQLLMQAPVQTLTDTAQLSGPNGKGHAGQCRRSLQGFVQPISSKQVNAQNVLLLQAVALALTCSPPHSQGSSQRPTPAPVLHTPASQWPPLLAYRNRQSWFLQTRMLQTVA